MAFFKFRKGGDGSASAPPQPESVEALRRRARQRLIGAAVLVLVGLVGFPLLFDTQPRPVAVDIPIEIPDRNKARPLPAPAVARGEVRASEPVAQAPAASQPVAPSAAAAPKLPADAGPVSVAAPEPAKVEPPRPAVPAKIDVRESAKAEAKPAPAKTDTAAKAPVSAPDASRAQALLEGKPVQVVAKEAVAGRYVVQVGAFADSGKARDTRQKVEKAGLKTYTHVAETRDGRRIRVRVGPFATRAEADKAAGRIKELDLPAAVLTL